MTTWKTAAVVVVLGLVALLYDTTPGRGRFLEPVTVAANRHGVAEAPDFQIAVDSVRTTRQLVVPSSLDPTKPAAPLSSTLGWVVVTVTAAATKQPTHLSGVRIKTRSGALYAVSTRGSLGTVDLTGQSLAVGLPVRAELAVEMPARLVNGARLEVSEHYFQALEAVASMPLPAADSSPRITVQRGVPLAPGGVESSK